jgi:hypothetical protein
LTVKLIVEPPVIGAMVPKKSFDSVLPLPFSEIVSVTPTLLAGLVLAR